jgi:hypothetical protein
MEKIMNTANSYGGAEAERTITSAFTSHLPAIARILMGLPLIVFGLNGFFNFIRRPRHRCQRRPLLLLVRWRTPVI